MGDQGDDALSKGQNSFETKEGQYRFTPLQQILINKLMPPGFKLESEENMLKAVETIRPAVKKQKTSYRDFGGADEQRKKKSKKMDFSDVTSKENSEFSATNVKRSLREKKPTVYEDLGYVEKDKLKGPKNPILADVAKKCERGFQKIKRHPFAEFFLNPITPDAPSLNQIEKNLKNYQYTNTYTFGLDLRKLWSYYFATYTNNAEIFQKTCKLSEFSEDVLKELESSQEEKSDLQELSKKVQQLTKEIKEISGKGGQPTPLAAPKKGEKGGSIIDKPMTMTEKNNLGNSIRTLTPDQLKGIVNILSDSLVIDPQSKYFEFDIETLGTRKLRELEQYVKKCLRTKPTQTKPTEIKQVKKNVPQPTSSEMSEIEKIAQLKSDLGVKKAEMQPLQNAPTTTTTAVSQGNVNQQQLKRPVTQKRDEENNKKFMSDSDDSLSSSEDSDSESLSSLDFKKQPQVGNK